MKKAAIYIRVSTLEQTKGWSIEGQKERLVNYCKAKEWAIQDIYIDDGYTGTNTNRPALKSLLNNLDKIDSVLVYKLDRLSRSQKDVLTLVEDEFLSKDVDFVSMLENFDTSTPFGRAMLGILAVFAQLERDTIVERSRLGKEKRVKSGLWRGGGNVPFGYEFKDNQLIINKKEEYIVKKIYDLYLEGLGYNKIVRKLTEDNIKNRKGNNFHVKQVMRILTNKTYLGLVEYRGEYFVGEHKALVDKELFDKVQKIRKTRKTGRSATKYLLSGFLYCKYCGARLRASWSTAGKHPKKYYHYLCYSVVGGPPHMVKDKYCFGRAWEMSKLDNMVIDKLKHYQFNEDKFREIFEESKTDNTEIETKKMLLEKIKDIDKRINKLMELYMDETMPTKVVSEKVSALHKEKEELEKQNQAIKIESNASGNFEEYLAILKDFDNIWENATFDEKKIILNGLIDKIIVSKDDFEIQWNNFSNM